jgi:hypothetical protein
MPYLRRLSLTARILATGLSPGKDRLSEEDFCRHAKILSYYETDPMVDAVGATAVASFAFAMVYTRDGSSYRATGRDLWVFGRKLEGEGWLAVWRTLLELQEVPV